MLKKVALFISLLVTSPFLLAETETCTFDAETNEHCGFYKDAEMTIPVDVVDGALVLNTENRYAYKSLKGKEENYFLVGMFADTEEGISPFYSVEFQLLDENGEVAFVQFCGGPEVNVVTEQDVYRNEGQALRIYYAGEKEGNLRFPSFKAMVKAP